MRKTEKEQEGRKKGRGEKGQFDSIFKILSFKHCSPQLHLHRFSKNVHLYIQKAFIILNDIIQHCFESLQSTIKLTGKKNLVLSAFFQDSYSNFWINYTIVKLRC